MVLVVFAWLVLEWRKVLHGRKQEPGSLKKAISPSK